MMEHLGKEVTELSEGSLEHTTTAVTYVGTELVFVPLQTLCCATVHELCQEFKLPGRL